MKMPSSRYRGVVAQQSGKWGAQIYKNDNRIWLGTFRTEAEAARTYDLAARCLHGRNAVLNFNSSFTKSSDIDADDEVQFLKLHTTTEILSMLRRQTYHDELKRSNSSNNDRVVNVREGRARQLLFVKVIAPGDVGPQNRLLIPRQHAKNHFPCLDCNNGRANRTGTTVKFEDEKGKIWRFRYAFWSSSGIRVFNGGWAEFAREKGLRAGDEIKFWRGRNELGGVQFFVECHFKRTTIEPSPVVLDLPLDRQRADKIIRLFGVNVLASVNNN